MKNPTILTSAIAISLALFQPISAHAGIYAKKDDDQNEQKGNKSHGGGGKAGNPAQAVPQARGAAPSGHVKGGAARGPTVITAPGNPGAGHTQRSHSAPVQAITTPGNSGHTQRSRSAPVQAITAPGAGVTQRSSRFSPLAPVASQRSGYSARGGNVQPYGNQGAYTRENRYGGLWFDGGSHRDWNRSGVHYWNHHRYGWYDGGWLILDGGYQPEGITYADYSGDSTVARVQRKLSARGYSLGSADGVIGPATRTAIAQYQEDNGLAPTGRINDQLLVSLGLE